MSPRTLTLLALICALSTGTAVWDRLREEPLPRSQRLFAGVETTRVQSMHLELEGTTSKVWMDANGARMDRGDGAVPVDAAAWQRRLEVLPLLRSHRRGSSSFEARGRVSFELGDSGSVVLELGAKSEDGRYQWVRVEGQSPTLVEAHLVNELVGDLDALVDLRVLPFALSLRKPLLLSHAGQVAEMDMPQRRFVAEERTPVRLDSSAAAAYIESLRGLRFTRALPVTESCDGQPAITIAQGDAELQIWPCDERLAVGAWDLLLQPLSEPHRFADRGLLPPLTASSTLEIRCDGQEPIPLVAAELDAVPFARWWERIRGAGGTPQRLSSKEVSCRLVTDGWTLLVEEGQARREGEGWAMPMDKSVETLLRVTPEHFASPQLIDEEAVYALSIDIRDGKKRLQLRRGQLLESWTADGLDPLSASELAIELRAALASLRLDEVVPSSLRAEERKGMGKPRTIEVVFEDAMGKESRRYALRIYRGRNSGCVVELEGGTGGWLGADRCGVLMQPL